jgi:hypothetical protein
MKSIIKKIIPAVQYYDDSLIAWMEAEGWARLECVGHEHPPHRMERAWYWFSGSVLFWIAQGMFAICNFIGRLATLAASACR